MSFPSALRNALVFTIAAVMVAPPLRGDEADDQYAIAAGHYDQRRWQFAAETFRTFVEGFPNHPKAGQAVFFLSEALLQLGEVDQAEARFQEYLKREPEGRYARSAQFRAGESAYLAERHQQAKAQLEEFYRRYPKDKLNAYVLSYLGEITLAEQDVGQAEKYFRQVLADFPKASQQDQCRFGLARALEKQGEHKEAERLFLAVAGKTGSPLSDDAQFRLGALQYATGRYEESIATFGEFETRLASSPWRPTVRLGLGWALVKLNRLDEATTFFQSITADPKVGMEARYWLGLVQKAQGDWQAAVGTLIEAARVDPDHQLVPAIRVHAGHALLRTEDPAAAAEQFALAMDSPAPGNEWVDDALCGKIQAALGAKDHEGVQREAAEFVRRFPESPLKSDVDRMLAQSFVERKDFGRAIGILEPLVAAASDQQDSTENRYLLALAYEGIQRREDALATLEPVLESAGSEFHTDAQLTQASLLVSMKRYDEAIVPLKAFLAGEPTGDSVVKALGQLAVSYAHTGKLDQAKQVYIRLLEQHGSHELIVPVTEQMAEAAYDAGEVEWSTKLFGWLGRSSRSTEFELKGLAGLAWSQFKTGKLEEAASTFDELLEKKPEPALASEAALARGQILQQLGSHDDALEMYDLVIQEFTDTPQHPEALLAAGRLRDDLGKDEDAQALYERLIRQYPKISRIDAVLYQWAWALHDLGRTDDAAGVFRRIHQDHRDSEYWADATYRLADHAYRGGDYATSGQMAAAVLGGKPDDTIRQNALFLQGQIASAEGKWAEASDAFAALVQKYPEGQLRLRAEYGVAEATFQQNDHEAAVALFQHLVDQTQNQDEPWFALIHLRLAQSLAQQKKWDEAYEIASRIEERYPGFEEQYEADYIVGRCLAAQADFEGARAAYGKVYRSPNADKTETAAEARFMIAESYFHQKNYEDALREYLALEILYAYPVWQAAAVLQAGKCYEELGEWSKAVEQYAKVLQVHGDTKYAEEAGQRMPSAKQKAEMSLAG